MNDAIITQFTHERSCNGVCWERWHEYSLSIEGPDEKKIFEQFQKETGYEWNSEDNMATSEVPEGFKCWCGCMHQFLLKNGFELKHVTSKFFIFTKVV
jgi:hypothetical protein